MVEETRRWVEETEDPVTGEALVFEAATEAELDAQVAAWFGEDLVGSPKQPDDGAGPGQGRGQSRVPDED